MTRGQRAAAGLGAIVMALAACSSPTADVTAAELRAVIDADAIVFEDQTVPGPVVDRLAENRLVLLGETHHLREHWAFVAELMSELYDDGFRQLLVERPHMNDWLIDDYVLGGELAPDWVPPPYFDRRFTAIREINAALPAEQRIHVRSTDANEDFAGGATDFVSLFYSLALVLHAVRV